MRRRHWVWAASAVAVAVVVVAATIGVRVFGTSDEAVAVSTTAQWDAKRRLGMSSVTGVELRGDAAIVLGTVEDDNPMRTRLAVVDADSGEPRWVVDAGMRLDSTAVLDEVGAITKRATGPTALPHVVGSGDDWSVLVGYAVPKDTDDADVDPSIDDMTEHGVAALSGRDGSVTWRSKLSAGARPLATDGRTVLVAAGGAADPGNDGQGGEPVTYALDATDDGRVLWKSKGWIHALAGDTALGIRGAPNDWQPGLGETTEGGSVVALDARTGERRWDLADRYATSSLQGAVDGRALLRVANSEVDTHGVLVDTTNGREVETFDGEHDAGYMQCDTDAGDDLLTCLDVGEPWMLSVRAGGRGEPVRAEVGDLGEEATLLDLDAVSRGRAYLTAQDSSGGKPRSLAVAREGATAAESLPGRVIAASADHVAVLEGSRGETGTMSVHRVADGADPPKAEPRATPSPRPAPVDTKPLWGMRSDVSGSTPVPPGSPRIELEGLGGPELAAGVLVYLGEGYEGNYYEARDPATGKRRWRLDGEKGLGDGDVPSDLDLSADNYAVAGKDDGLLLLEYQGADDGANVGVAAVSVKTGEVRWKQPYGSGSNRYSGLVDAGAETYVVASSSDDTADTTAYDVTSHRELWSEKRARPVAVVGESVVVEKASKEDGEGPRDVLALDARSGETRWRLGDRYEEPRVAAAAEGAVLVRHTGGTAVLDPATGEELARTPTRLSGCTGSADPLLVCDGGDGRSDERTYPVSVDVAAESATVRLLPQLSAHAQLRAWGDWLYATPPSTQPTNQGGRPAFQTLDAQGRPVAGNLPGGLVAANDDHAVLLDGHFGDLSYSGATLTIHDRT